MNSKAAIRSDGILGRTNGLLFCLILLSLIIHGAAVLRLSPLFQSKKMEAIEIEIRSPRRISSPDIPQPPAQANLPPRFKKTSASVKPVPIPETDLPNLDAFTPPAPDHRVSKETPKKPALSQPEILPWSPPEIKPPAPPIHSNAVRPQRFTASPAPVPVPDAVSPQAKTSSAAPSSFPTAVQPDRPKVSAVQATAWAGPKTGTAPENAGQKESGNYFGLVRARIEERKRYPLVARKRGVEGQVLVQFTINPDGSLKGLKILKKSPHGILNRAALSAVEDAAPFPKPPAKEFTGPIPLQITIVFHIK